MLVTASRDPQKPPRSVPSFEAFVDDRLLIGQPLAADREKEGAPFVPRRPGEDASKKVAVVKRLAHRDERPHVLASSPRGREAFRRASSGPWRPLSRSVSRAKM